MPILMEANDVIRFRLTDNILQFFNKYRIKSHPISGESRWRPGDILSAAKDLVLQPHVILMQGDAIPRIGAFSYSFSPMSPYIRIGRYCSISWNVRRMGPQHNHNLISTSEIMYRRDTMFTESLADFKATPWKFYPGASDPAPTIGNDVWIGQDVLLGPKAILGDGCVVAAGAVVTKEMPPYSIVGGVPARVLKWRFDPEIIAALCELKWWSYALPDLAELPLDKPADFIPRMRNLVDQGRVQPFQPQLGRLVDVIAATD